MAGNTNSVTGYAEAFYDAYTTGYEAILQEKKFFWEGTMRMEPLQGENQSYDFVSSIDLDEKVSRFEDIPIEDMTHNRRWISPKYFRKGIFVDDEDQIALHTDPTSDYMQALLKGSIRTMNGIGTTAFFGTVRGGIEPGVDRTGTATTYAFTNTAIDGDTAGSGGRTIPHDSTKNGASGGTSTGLTIDKMIIAREALVQLNNDPDETFYIAVNPRQKSDLLRSAETQSSDTSAVKALVAGEINTYMGFQFIETNQVAIGSSNDIDSNTNIYPCPVWTKEGMLFARHKAPMFDVDKVVRKQVWQIAARMGANAIRMDEDKVLKIECAAV